MAVAIAGLLLGAAVASALRSATLPRPDRRGAEQEAPAAEESRAPAVQPAERAGSVSDEVIQHAAERAPFSADRQSSRPYQLPEERVVPEPIRVDRPEPPPAPAFRVLGTIADANGGIAVIEAPGELPRVVTVGDEILGFRLSRIEAGRVVLGDGEGRSLSVAVPEVAPRTAAAAPGHTGRGQQNRNAGFTPRAREVIGGPSNPAADAVNEAIARLRQQSGGGDVRMEMRGDRVILTGADGSTREIPIGSSAARSNAEWVVTPPPAPPQPASRPRRPGGGE
jgi:hypothetical protein